MNLYYNMVMQKIAVSRAEKLAVLKTDPYFFDLDEKVLGDLALGTSLRRYLSDEIVCWQGEVCEGLFILQQGSVKLFKLSPKGRELIIRVLQAGATFNEVPVFDRGHNPINVAALEECQIWLVEAQIIRRCMEENPQMAQAVIQNLTENLRTLVGIVEELSFYQVTNRLARLIGRMTPEQLEERITQDQLAARLGTVREVAARSLRELERSGAIRVARRKIQVLDTAILDEWAEASDL